MDCLCVRVADSLMSDQLTPSNSDDTGYLPMTEGASSAVLAAAGAMPLPPEARPSDSSNTMAPVNPMRASSGEWLPSSQPSEDASIQVTLEQPLLSER